MFLSTNTSGAYGDTKHFISLFCHKTAHHRFYLCYGAYTSDIWQPNKSSLELEEDGTSTNESRKSGHDDHDQRILYRDKHFLASDRAIFSPSGVERTGGETLHLQIW